MPLRRYNTDRNCRYFSSTAVPSYSLELILLQNIIFITEFDEDFVSKPYFESIVVFEVDEELPDPVNQVNVSIELVNDTKVERSEFFVVTVELRSPCQIQRFAPLSLVSSRKSTLIHILDDDSKPFSLCCCCV